MSAPPPLPPRTKNGTSNNDHPTLSPFYATSLSSYQSACQREAELYEQGHVAEAYQIFQAFVEEEGKKRRQFYGRGLEKEPRAVNKVEAVRFEGDEAQKERVPSDPSTPTLDVKEGQGAHANVADTTALTNSDDRSSVNKEQQNENPEPRPTLPASQDLASALDRAALLTSDPPTDLVDLMNKVQEATTQACTLSNLDRRWEFQSGEDSITQNLDSEASQRREANNNALKAFYGRSDWSGANTLQEAFEQNEKQIRLQNERDALERWRLGYFVPTLDRLAQTSQEIEALYANLKSDPKAIHHILTTLQRTHDTILTLISTTHDVNADWQRRVHQVHLSGYYSHNAWDQARQADETFEAEEKRTRIRMDAEKHAKLQAHVEWVKDACGNYVKDLEERCNETKQKVDTLLADIQQNASQDDKIYPSDALITQLQTTENIISALTDRLEHHLSTISSQTASLNSTAHSLSQSQLYAQNHWDMARSADDSFQKSESERYKAESACREKLLADLGVRALRDRIQNVVSDHQKRTQRATGDGGSGGDFASAYGKLMQQQMQTQMISNMLHTMHVSNMSVINNIGSSNTRWEYRRKW